MTPRLLLAAFLAIAGFLPARGNQPPTVSAPAGSTLRVGGTEQTVDLATVFTDPDPGSQVRINVRIGATIKPIDLVLYNADKPITSTNFLSYLNSNRYSDNFFHRSVPGFIIQNGGFRWTSESQVGSVPTDASIQNEPGISNLRGTIAMAKLGGDPNSATSQWFINLANNSANLDAQNSGFTVFGRVINGMDVADEIAALKIVDAGSPFDTLPVKNFTSGSVQRVHTVETDAVLLPAGTIPALTYTATSSNTAVVTATLQGSSLKIVPAGTAGTANIVLAATDLQGASSTATLAVTVVPVNAGWRYEQASSGAAAAFSFDSADSTAPGAAATIDFGTQPVQSQSSLTFSFTNRGQTDLTGFQVAIVGNANDYSVEQPAGDGLVAAGASANFTVSFTPSTRSVRSATLRLSTSNPNFGYLDVPLSGTGTSTDAIIAVSGAYKGAAVPQTGSAGLPLDGTLTTFGVPAVSDVRSLAARVTLTASRRTYNAVYGEDNSGVGQLYAFQTKAADGVVGATYKTFLDPVLAPNGAVAFGATLSGVPATEDQGIWSNLFGSLQPVLREGKQIPGLNALKLKSVTSVSLANDAMLALVKLSPGVGTVINVSDTALVRVTGASASTLLAKTGADFDNSTITALAVLQPAVGSPGQGRWQSGSDTIARFTLKDRRTAVVRISSAGVKTKLVQAGVTDAGLATKFTTLGLPAIGGTSVAVLATEAAKTGVTTLNDSQLLYLASGSALAVAVRENDPANVPEDAKFATFTDPVVNSQGTLLFQATLRGAVAAASRSGLWWNGGGAGITPVVRQGAPAVDEDGVALPGLTWTAFTNFALPDGEASRPLFVATLAGRGTTAANRTGLWALDTAKVPRLLLRTGTLYPVKDGEKKLTAFTLLNSLPGSFGVRRSYNSTGSAAVLATFDDRSQAVLRIDLPL